MGDYWKVLRLLSIKKKKKVFFFVEPPRFIICAEVYYNKRDNCSENQKNERLRSSSIQAYGVMEYGHSKPRDNHPQKGPARATSI